MSATERDAALHEDSHEWHEVERVLEALAAGDVSGARQQIAQLPPALQPMFTRTVDKWNSLFADVLKQTSAAIEHGMKPLAAARQLAADTRRQHTEADQLAAATEQLAASVDEVASNARHAADGASRTIEQVEQGLASIGEALSGITEVSKEMETLRDRVDQMASAVAPIQQVLELIREVSDQTNLLALNAAIEAARAGEHGRGFAVVAAEVRRLAERTQGAVRDVQDKIQALLAGAELMGAAMDEVGAKVAAGAELAESGRHVLEETRTGIQQGMAPLMQIAAATDQQTAAVSVMADSTQEISEATGSIGTAAAELAVMVDDLQQALRTLREAGAAASPQLSDRDLLSVSRADHLLWIQRLNRMLLDREHIDPASVADHTQCRLGRWYFGRGQELYGDDPAFLALNEPHRRLHEQANVAVLAWQQGRRAEAEAIVAELAALSGQIVSGLDALMERIQ